MLLVFSGCSQVPDIYRVDGKLTPVRQINSAIEVSKLQPNIGIKVVSLNSGKTLYSLNSDHLFTPASNNKLYTAVSALKLLTPEFKFSTVVSHQDKNIALIGGGDPDLLLTQLDSLAEIVSQTVAQIDTLFIDDTLFDPMPYGEGWMWDEGHWWYAAPISALTVNDNCIDFYIYPGKIGKPVVVETSPNTKFISLTNNTLTVNDTAGFEDLSIKRNWFNHTNDFTISGDIMDTTAVDTIYRNIEQPTLFTGTVFSEMLSYYGKNPTTIIQGQMSGDSNRIAEFTSASLLESVTNLMKESDNLTAEMLIKMIGHKSSGGQGSWSNGLSAVKTFLQEDVGIDTTIIRLADGSGMSRYNLTTPDILVDLLTYAYHSPDFRELFISTLPVGGWDGTLKDRMEYEIGSRIHAKTGTLSGVSCLSGYAFTLSGEPLAFSIMINGYVGSAEPYRKLQDDICKLLTYY